MKNFILLLNFILLPSASVHTLAQEAYAVMSKDSTTLTFYYDNLKASREGTKIQHFKRNEHDHYVRRMLQFGKP